MTQELVDNGPATSVSLLGLMAVLGVPWDALGCHGTPWDALGCLGVQRDALVLMCMISITGTTGTTQKRPCW